MNFRLIIKSAWKLTWRNQFVWLLGLLAMWVGGGSVLNFFSYDSSDDFGLANLIQKILDIQHFFTGMGQAMWPIIFAFLIIVFAFLFLFYSAKAGIIISIDALRKGNKPMGFGAALRTGAKRSMKLFLLNIMLGITGLVLVLIILCLGIGFLGNVWQIGFTAFALVISFCLFIYLSLLTAISERMIVLQGKSLTESILSAGNLINKKYQLLFVAWLVNTGLAILYSIVLGLLGLSIIFIMLLILGMPALGWLYAMVFIFLGISILMINAMFTAFLSGFWTLVFREVMP